jgi:hypothetical protein
MSLNPQRLEVTKCLDPRVTAPGASAPYIYVEGAANVTQKSYTTSSASEGSLQFSSANPPNKHVFVDRKIYIQVGIRLSMSCASTGANQFCLTPGHDALRCYPFSSVCSVTQATLNNFSISVNTADVLHPLVDRYNVDNRLKNGMYSTAPSYPDQAQLYSSLVDSNRSELGSYDFSTDENIMPRGGYSQFYIQSNSGPSTAAGQTLNAVVDFVTTEPLFLLSPIVSSRKEASGFINLATFDMNFTLLSGVNGFNRMWSRSELDPVLTGSYQFASLITTGPAFYFSNFARPQLLFQYFQPKESMLLPINGLSLYNYYDTQRYPSDVTGVPQYPAYATYSTNSIQLSGIPSRVFIFARQPDYIQRANCSVTDTFASINNISIQYNARSGLMASCTPQVLYQISRKNGCNLNYTQWLGAPVYAPGSFNNALRYSTIGSVICLDLAQDIGLGSLEADNKNTSANLQINVSISSLIPGVSAYTIYVIVVSGGIFSIHNGVSNAQVNVLTSEDILNAKRQPGINIESIKSMGSGDFLSGLKSFWNEKLSPFLKTTKLASNLLSLVPVIGGPLSSAAKKYGYGDQMGYGDDMGYGEGNIYDPMVGQGVNVGGRMMREAQEQSRHIMM